MRYKAICAFKGYHYHGWQIQPHQPTIQQCVEKALYTITKSKGNVIGCSRTDARVSALGFVFHFDTDIDIPDDNFVLAFNANLPSDIRILSIRHVDETFHARFDVIKKRYVYTIETGRFDVFAYEYVHQLNRALDLPLMKQASACFLGTHDFTSFNATPLDVIADQTRTIDRLDVIQEGTKIIVIVEAKAFLHHMVRMIVQTLIEVGTHKLQPETIQTILKAKDKRACPFNAPPEGLLLERVWYDNDF